MFFGEVIEQQKPFQISVVSDNNKTLQLTNAVLDDVSDKAELYLRAKDKNILLARLNSSILQSNLNVLIELEENPSLITKNGNIHVCGHFTKKSLPQNQNLNLVSDSIINTNKKINQLSKQHIKYVPTQKGSKKQSQNHSSQQENQKKREPQIVPTPRQSSRLSTRRTTTPSVNSQVIRQVEKSSTILKKDTKNEKKKQKSESVLKNGRYSLKALLQNIEDDEDEESDGQFSNSQEDQQSDEDSQSQDDEGEQEEDTILKSKTSLNKQNNKNLTKSKSENAEKQVKGKQEKEKKHQNGQKQKTSSISLGLKMKLQPQVEIGQQQDSDSKKQINTEQFQQKWPEVTEPQVQKEANERQQKISELASKIKFPTKKPTI